MTAGPGQVPFFTIVRGEPTDAELAAVTCVLAARAVAIAEMAAMRATGRTSGASEGQWTSRSRLMRQPIHPGPGAWRASALRW